MAALKYSFFLDNYFKKPDSKTVIDDPLTFLNKLHYYKLSSFCIHRLYYHQRLILPILLRFHLLASFCSILL